MRVPRFFRFFLMLVLVVNGLAVAHALAPPAPADTAAMAGASCHDQEDTAVAVHAPAPGVYDGSHAPACCQDLCQCACALPALATVPPLSAGPWGRVSLLPLTVSYPSLASTVLLRPPIA
ncbi:MAG: hypothetical protein K0S46_511 [Moraxellaceae bacterium]|jgi:hypothetical protein|nr:hypothetical protein [Moraxellaceae bacterium]